MAALAELQEAALFLVVQEEVEMAVLLRRQQAQLILAAEAAVMVKVPPDRTADRALLF